MCRGIAIFGSVSNIVLTKGGTKSGKISEMLLCPLALVDL
jgi:hypothetical protein